VVIKDAVSPRSKVLGAVFSRVRPVPLPIRKRRNRFQMSDNNVFPRLLFPFWPDPNSLSNQSSHVPCLRLKPIERSGANFALACRRGTRIFNLVRSCQETSNGGLEACCSALIIVKKHFQPHSSRKMYTGSSVRYNSPQPVEPGAIHRKSCFLPPIDLHGRSLRNFG